MYYIYEKHCNALVVSLLEAFFQWAWRGVKDDIRAIQEVYIALHIIFDNIFVKWEEIG